MGTRGLRNGAILTFFLGMAILLIGGYYAVDHVPPIPEKVMQGQTELTRRSAILRGQATYQRYGLMDHGSIWGHGSLRGMDFSAHTLHMVGQHVRDFLAAEGQPQPGAYEKLPVERRREIDAAVIAEIRVNRYEEKSKTLQLTAAQTYALERMRAYWEKEFGEGDNRYGFLRNTVPTAAERRDIADFFFWTAWAAGTPRPNLAYTYTNNWPSDRSVGNTASTQAFLWSILSILALFAILGLVIYIVHRH